MSERSGYRGRNSGRVFYAVEVFCRSNHDLAHQGVISFDDAGGYLTYRSKKFATFQWAEDPADDRPIFTFIDIDDDLRRVHATPAETWQRAQFLKRPYLDDRQVLFSIDYTVQAIADSLTFSEAKAIRHVRDKLNGEWNPVTVPVELEQKIQRVIKESSHGYINDDNADWRHLAFCAIYEI